MKSISQFILLLIALGVLSNAAPAPSDDDTECKREFQPYIMLGETRARANELSFQLFYNHARSIVIAAVTFASSDCAHKLNFHSFASETLLCMGL
ncbi:hypothetical protein DPV78_002479 [Talaromyces pinophilus]|nr:hypothetical protein DPV78_002479 [Talaromyces pinophilus]